MAHCLSWRPNLIKSVSLPPSHPQASLYPQDSETSDRFVARRMIRRWANINHWVVDSLIVWNHQRPNSSARETLETLLGSWPVEWETHNTAITLHEITFKLKTFRGVQFYIPSWLFNSPSTSFPRLLGKQWVRECLKNFSIELIKYFNLILIDLQCSLVTLWRWGWRIVQPFIVCSNLKF